MWLDGNVIKDMNIFKKSNRNAVNETYNTGNEESIQ